MLPFSVWWWRDEVTMQVLRRQKDTQAKRDLIMEKIRSPIDAWKGYLKSWDHVCVCLRVSHLLLMG